MSSGIKEYSTRIVGLLIIVMAVTDYFLWWLSPVNTNGEAIFAIFLAVDLVAFMMITYICRTYKSGDQFSKALLIGSSAMITACLRESCNIVWRNNRFGFSAQIHRDQMH